MNLKTCINCGIIKPIWKNFQGKKYCKSCWSQKIPTKKPTLQKPIARRSSKQAKKEAAYMVIRNMYIKNHPMCEAHIQGVCTQVSSDVHHKKGRGEYLLDDTTFLAVCRGCHQYIETNPTVAKELGFSINRLN